MNVQEPALFIHTPNALIAQALVAALPTYPTRLITTGAMTWRHLPEEASTLLLVDAPPRHTLIQLGQRLRIYRPQCRIIFLMALVDLLGLHVAQRCGAAGILYLPDQPLTYLPLIVRRVIHGEIYYSGQVQQVCATSLPLLKQLAALSLAGSLVLVQMVEGIKPAHIARNLSASIASVYQQQARLRMHFGVSSNADLITLFQVKVMLGENE